MGTLNDLRTRASGLRRFLRRTAVDFRAAVIAAAVLAASASSALAQQTAIGSSSGTGPIALPYSAIAGTISPGTSGAAVDFSFPMSLPRPGQSPASAVASGGITRGAALRIIAGGLARASWVGVAFTAGMAIYDNYGVAGDGQGGLTIVSGGSAPVPYDPSGWVNNGNHGGVHGSMQAAIDAWVSVQNSPAGPWNGSRIYQVGAAGVCGLSLQSWGYLVSLNRYSAMGQYEAGNTATSCQSNAMAVGPPDGSYSGSTACPGGAQPINGLCGGAPAPTTADGAAGAVPDAGSGGPSNADLANAVAQAVDLFGPQTMRASDILNPQMNVTPGGYAGPVTTAEDIFGTGGSTTTEVEYDWTNGPGVTLPVPSGNYAGIPYTWNGTHIHAGSGGTTHIHAGNAGTTHIHAQQGTWAQTTTVTTRDAQGNVTGQTRTTTNTSTGVGVGTGTGTATGNPGTDPCAIDPGRVGCLGLGPVPAETPATRTISMEYTLYPVALPEGCPAPLSLPIVGSWSWQGFCDTAVFVRPAVIALASWFALMLVFGTVSGKGPN